MFGDSDSSDSDSEIGTTAAASETAAASPPITKTEDEEENDESNKKSTDDNKMDDETTKQQQQEDDDDDEAVAEGSTKETSEPKDNNGLFGDDDDSENSDDDEEEFDDKDIIVGKKKKLTKVEEDNDNKHEYSNVNKNDTHRQSYDQGKDYSASTKQRKKSEPAVSEIRRMEILDIAQPRYRNEDVNNATTNTSRSNEEKKENDLTFHVTKLPNLVGINPEAFDPKTYDAGIEEAEYKGYIHNMIRWRYKKDPTTGELLRDGTAQNKLLRESNAKFVKWSDGSYTLHVGNESFEVDNIGDLASESPYTGVNGYLYLSQTATMEKDTEHDDDKSPKSLTVLECMGPIQSKMIARPSSLQSEAHKNLTLAVRQRNMKKARIAEYVTQVDPEKEKLERIKNNEDFNKQQQQRQPKQRGHNRGMGGRRRRYTEDEEDDRYDNVNLSRLKRRNYEEDEIDYDYGRDSDEEEDDWYKRKKDARSKPNRASRRYSDDDDSYEEQARGSRKLYDDDDNDRKGGRKKIDDASEEEGYFEESDGEDAVIPKGSSKKRSHAAVFDDDDE